MSCLGLGDSTPSDSQRHEPKKNAAVQTIAASSEAMMGIDGKYRFFQVAF